MVVADTVLKLTAPLVSAVDANVTPDDTDAIKKPVDVYNLIVIDPVVLILFGVPIDVNVIKLRVSAETDAVVPGTVNAEEVSELKVLPLVNIPDPEYDDKLAFVVTSVGKVN